MANFGPLTAEMGLPVWAPMFAVSWAGTPYIHFLGLLPLTEFSQVQNSLCVQVLRSPIMPGLEHCTPAETFGD